MDIKDKLQKERIIFIQRLEEIIESGEKEIRKYIFEQASKQAGFEENYYKALFEGDEEKIIEGMIQYYLDKMHKNLSKREAPEKVRDKIGQALFEYISLVPKEVHKALYKYFLRPLNAPLGMKTSWEICDQIWRYAGDKSTDFNHYSKRGLLLPVTTSSIAFYLNDKSDNYASTKQYIETSLDCVVKTFQNLGKIKLSKLKDIPIIRMFF